MYYSEELIEEIRSRNDIVDVVSDYVKLKKTGNTYFGLCPFHNEKSPSFSVNGQRQIFHCFGCGEGGNVYSFIMKYENYTFPEAVRYLAERAGVEVPKMEYSPDERKRDNLRTSLLEVNKESAMYFFRLLKSESGQMGYEYLRNRGLSDETIVKFGLGYSSNYKDDLYRHLKGKGYSDDILKESGLFTYTERGVYDKFANRVMFPIMDINNKVIGFGGRVMGQGEPKYLNSPETVLFDKSRNLYGMNYARTSRKDYLLICEGYMDVISLHQAGFTNAVASLGTAFTTRQCLLMKRYTKNVYLTYDSDGAGVKAALRAIPMIKEAGLTAKVINMSPFKDPDEFIKNQGAEAYEERIQKARNSFLFEIDKMKETVDFSDPEGKSHFYMNVAKKLLEFEDELERNVYIDTVSQEYGIPKDSLIKSVNKLAYTYVASEDKEKEEKRSNSQRVPKDNGILQAQKILITWILDEPSLLEKILPVINENDFVEPVYNKVAAILFQQIQNNDINPARIIDQFESEDEHREVSALFNAPLREEMSKAEKEKALNETVIRIKKNSLDNKSRKATDVKELQEIMKQQQQLRSVHIYL
ncbi:MAG: DNA primase [Lachnospiraceae bacterium]|nr:DNA primase [Lachnospiraceae bacterium]